MNKSLLNGLVPAGDPCPFLDKCKFKVHQCPTDTNIKATDYFCAAARIHANLVDSEKQEVRHIVEKKIT